MILAPLLYPPNSYDIPGRCHCPYGWCLQYTDSSPLVLSPSLHFVYCLPLENPQTTHIHSPSQATPFWSSGFSYLTIWDLQYSDLLFLPYSLVLTSLPRKQKFINLSFCLLSSHNSKLLCHLLSPVTLEWKETTRTNPTFHYSTFARRWYHYKFPTTSPTGPLVLELCCQLAYYLYFYFISFLLSSNLNSLPFGPRRSPIILLKRKTRCHQMEMASYSCCQVICSLPMQRCCSNLISGPPPQPSFKYHPLPS